TQKRKRQQIFANELKSLLYAFGDVPNPLPETVNTLDDILQTFLVDTCHKAHEYAVAGGLGVTKSRKMKVEDFKFVFRNDEVKVGRIEELLKMSKEIEEAKKLYDVSDAKLRSTALSISKDAEGKNTDKD
ncbi:hypothetical protein BABINDRAFT_18856, partial [Babjeviella inositovora NRRL Y-12698]